MAPAAGVYFIEVSRVSRSGDYVLSMSGNTPVAPTFQVTAINPPNGAESPLFAHHHHRDFNDAVYSPSVDVSDLLVDGLRSPLA